VIAAARRVGAVGAAALALAGCGAATHHPTGPATGALRVTAAVRASLLAAGAANHSLPVADFTGLAPGRTYYAYDRATRRYYAAAALVASASSTPAQVSTQDDGAYDLFVERPGGAWRVYNDGLGGAQDSVCPITLPAPVLAAWHWRAGACYPPTG
jgi:hypothetical protein